MDTDSNSNHDNTDETQKEDVYPISERIRNARLAAGVSQDELADVLGCHKRSIQGWEAGRLPSQKWLRPLSKCLNIPVTDLID